MRGKILTSVFLLMWIFFAFNMAEAGGRSYDWSADYGEREMMKKELSDDEDVKSEKHQQTVQNQKQDDGEWKRLYENAMSLYNTGQAAEALEVSNEAMKMVRKQFGEEHINFGLTLALQARIYTALKQYTKAEPLFRRAEAVLVNVFTPKGKDPAVNYEATKRLEMAEVITHHAELYRLMGRFEDAESVHNWSLELKKEFGNPYGKETAESLYYLAEIYRTQKKFDKADEYYKRAMNIFENTLGAFHMSYVKTLMGIAANYHTQKKYLESELFYRRALAIVEETKGADSREAKLIRANMAVLYEEQGLHMDAIKMKMGHE